ncbi:TetR/AcrR family transcriptional regulator [Rhizobacter sp. OV335]|jgi:AcrR family transcriptional regulator|uniref:TetR/AcrR family transcriptional regulator n=1 Tax=Rhizobacter sp. OV335 TaxID=1500264 RepID=UPI0009106911|nr:TetR/AcrR family transcriptional regulator [Rhizobacter sp. OV335]SHN12245.1 transcriptional regulator, TetR family [Rhizobacter sp. OV335]
MSSPPNFTPQQTTLTPRKAPRQARSRATVDAILDAAARVLVERGYAATTTNAVAEVAGVSVGSLYQYFPNKDSLIAALHDRHGRQMSALLDAALLRHRGASLPEALAGVIESAVKAHQLDADLHRVLEKQVLGLDQFPGDDESVDEIERRLRELLEAYRAEIVVEDLRLATWMLMHAVHALIHAVVLERPSGVSVKAATRETVRMALAYLTARL